MRSRILFAAFGVLVTSLSLFLPAAAHAAGGSTLEQFVNYESTLYNRASNDAGATWSFWNPVPATLASGCSVPSNFWFAFEGAPTSISDQPGRFWLVARTVQGYLFYNVYTSGGIGGQVWRGWCFVPGTGGWGAYFNSQAHTWMSGSWPSLASWGPGRVELFINTVNAVNGNLELSHTWGDGGSWSGSWEVLGTGLLSGSPSAVSWGPGRTDVFVRAANVGLAYKTFANGHWSGWQDTGANINSSPSVASMAPNRLDVFARSAINSHLMHLWFASGYMSLWEDLGGVLAGWSDFPPQATSREPFTLDVFVEGSDGVSWYEKSYFGGWYDFQYRGPVSPFNTGVPVNTSAVIYWDPQPPTSGGGGGGGGGGCFVACQ